MLFQDRKEKGGASHDFLITRTGSRNYDAEQNTLSTDPMLKGLWSQEAGTGGFRVQRSPGIMVNSVIVISE